MLFSFLREFSHFFFVCVFESIEGPYLVIWLFCLVRAPQRYFVLQLLPVGHLGPTLAFSSILESSKVRLPSQGVLVLEFRELRRMEAPKSNTPSVRVAFEGCVSDSLMLSLLFPFKILTKSLGTWLFA